MCFNTSLILPYQHWNWEGDTIVHGPVVPASRKIPGDHRKVKDRYDIDIREFLTTEDNAVVSRVIEKIIKALPTKDAEFFRSHDQGSFDFRMEKVLEYVTENIRYAKRSRKFDAWLFPDETLWLGEGDCEDRAFLLAALLLASGLSGYVVRVVLGQIYDHKAGKAYDHAWVVYKNESGHWILLEPQLFTQEGKKASKAPATGRKTEAIRPHLEYVPFFLFNQEHLWCLTRTTREKKFINYITNRKFWAAYNPSFATGVHNDIFNEALKDMPWYKLAIVKVHSLALDTTASYDPRDHFDNGFIPEAWDLVRQRLRTKGLADFAYAAHAIADFYAHSSYGHFAPVTNNQIPPLRGDRNYTTAGLTIRYDQPGFDLSGTNFTVNPAHCKAASRSEVARMWQGKLLSGRFAQPDDPSQGTLERALVYIPHDMLANEADFAPRYCLPHHDELAVDNAKRSSLHRLYPDPEYTRQFDLRKKAAVAHIGQVYREWK